MRRVEKQSIEAYQRIQRFMDAHPLPEPGGYGASRAVLEDVLEQLANHSTAQQVGVRTARGGTQRTQALVRRLRVRHLQPIARVARALLAGAPGIGVALRTPLRGLSVTQLVADATAVRRAVTPYEALFVANNLPGDFLAQLDAAIDALGSSLLDRAENIRERVGARAGIAHEVRRGRSAVQILDTFVEMRFADDPVMLEKWRSARRVQHAPVGVADGETDDVTDGVPACGGVAGGAAPGRRTAA